eukprot:2160583-Pyramimonas_sp.AAC.1
MGGPQEFQMTPHLTPRSGDGALQDEQQQWWQEVPPMVDPQALGAPVVRAPGGNLQQLTTGGGASACAGLYTPPGTELAMNTVIENLAGGRPVGPIPATHRPIGGSGPGGDACL